MTANIFIASHSVLATPGHHAYLIYDENTDGDNNFMTTTSDVRILRGDIGLNYATSDLSVVVEAREDVTTSLDWDDVQVDTNFTPITIPWTKVWEFAKTMGEPNDPAAGLHDTDIGYLLSGPNSNSVINTLLNVAGINFRASLPAGTIASQFPGHLDLLDGSGDSTFTAYIYDGPVSDTTRFFKRGGDDKILLEWNNFTNEHAQLHVFNENNATGLTTIFMDGLDFDDTITGNDADNVPYGEEKTLDERAANDNYELKKKEAA